MKQKNSLLVLFLLVILTVLVASPVLAQDSLPTCPPSATPAGCAVIMLKPDGLTGNFYEGETLLASAQSVVALSLPPGSHTITVRNIQSAEAGFVTLFTYKDAAANVSLQAGQMRSATATAQKQYIRGTLTVTCDIRNAAPGDPVGCQVVIDGVSQPEVVPPAGRRDYVLDPGAHALTVNLVGDQAGLWNPATWTQNVTIRASAMPQPVTLRFDKKALVTLNLSTPNVLADFYVDTQLVASQVAGYQLYVAPSKRHRFEARNITDPVANGLYRWRDAASTVFTSANSAKTVTFRLQKEWLKGFLVINCKVSNPPPGEALSCQPVIDGNAVQTIPVGGNAQFTLNPGSHEIRVTLVPQGNWVTQPYSTKSNVAAGQTATVTTNFRLQIPPVELLRNGNVESGGGTPDYWWSVNAGAGNARLSWSTEAALSGTRSLQISSDSVTAADPLVLWAQTAAGNIPVGQRLTLTVPMKLVNVSGSGIAIVIRADNTPTPADKAEMFSTSQGRFAIKGTRDWTPYTVKLPALTADIQSVTIYLLFLGGTSGTVYFDDISLWYPR